MTAGILLLAAGSSRRFGTDKRRAKMPDGAELLETTLKRIVTTQLPLLVCLGPNDRELSLRLSKQDIAWHLSPRSEKGMGYTLADGAAAIPAWSAVVIALADMPWIKCETYLAVAAATQVDHVCIPTSQGRRGHPVGFGSQFFGSLECLSGDFGARRLVMDNPEKVRELPVDDPGIFRDVDHPKDLV